MPLGRRWVSRLTFPETRTSRKRPETGNPRSCCCGLPYWWLGKFWVKFCKLHVRSHCHVLLPSCMLPSGARHGSYSSRFSLPRPISSFRPNTLSDQHDRFVFWMSSTRHTRTRVVFWNGNGWTDGALRNPVRIITGMAMIRTERGTCPTSRWHRSPDRSGGWVVR